MNWSISRPELTLPKRQRIVEAASRLSLWLLLLLFLPLSAFSQSKKDLEEKRKKIIRDIQATERMIKKTAKTKEATFDRFVALQSQIERREALIQN